jgi:hypothetical protein
LWCIRAAADAGRETETLSALVRDSDIPGSLAFVASLLSAMMALPNVMPGYGWWLLARRRSLRPMFAWRELP